MVNDGPPTRWDAAVRWLGLWLGLFVALHAARAEPVTFETLEDPGLPLWGMVSRVDLTDPRVRVVCPLAGDGSAAVPPPYVTTLQTVSEVLRRERLEVAVNGDFFAVDPTFVPPGGESSGPATSSVARRGYAVGTPAMPLGPAASRGRVYRKTGQRDAVSLVVGRDGRVRIEHSPDLRDASEAVSGNRLLVESGRARVAHDDAQARAPRTLAGLTADRRTLLLVVVDGRSVRSRGLTLGEAADLLCRLGADIGINLDGGGSSVMVRRGDDGQPQRLTRPSDGSERPVANVLGVRIEPISR